MLTIIVPAKEAWNDSTQEFITTKEQKLCLKHQLFSFPNGKPNTKKHFFEHLKKTQKKLWTKQMKV